MAEKTYYLAVDIGASSGRHILAYLEDGRIKLEEIYRFPNFMEEIHGHQCWNTERLLAEILEGLRKCREIGKIPCSMAIDTWGVDFVLLDKEGKRLGECTAYRDRRTEGMDEAVYKIISEEDLYARTGIQKAIFNTIYQLMAVKLSDAGLLQGADMLLMMPDYLGYCLTGVKSQEYTNATTAQLVNPLTKEWDLELIKGLGYPEKIFKPLAHAGDPVGYFTKEIQDTVGFNCKVVHAASHDTASAVMSVPSTAEDILYISSGTWSLMGTELGEAQISKASKVANFANEGGYAFRYRFLKNIMGLWMIQSVKKELDEGYVYEGRREDEDYSFSHLCEMAETMSIQSTVSANNARFLVPKSMIAEVQKACEEKGMEVPKSPWELAKVIYDSLALCYRETAREIEELTGRKYDTIHIVGGGSNASYLNMLTERMTGKKVIAGPAEATAIGNIGAQMLADQVFLNLQEFRACIFESFIGRE